MLFRGPSAVAGGLFLKEKTDIIKMWRGRIAPKGTLRVGLVRMEYFVYILQSRKVKRFYIGFTIDLQRRLVEHNNGKTRSTRPFTPWKLIYFETFKDKKEAYKREWHLKHPHGYKEKLLIIHKYGEVA